MRVLHFQKNTLLFLSTTKKVEETDLFQSRDQSAQDDAGQDRWRLGGSLLRRPRHARLCRRRRPFQ